MTLPFEGWPEAERIEVIPVSVELRIRQFCHRWGYNATAQQCMEVELRELLDAVRRGSVGEADVSPRANPDLFALSDPSVA